MYYTSRQVYEYISNQIKDPIIERKICKISGAEFPIYKSDMEFYDKISPVFGSPPDKGGLPAGRQEGGVKKYQIPTPTLCPEERQRRRLVRRNERKLYKRKCDATNKDIVSIYSKDSQLKIYDQKYWRSDNRNPLDYGINFDFNKTFSEQFKNLIMSVPRVGIHTSNSTNSDYTNHTGDMKDSYLSFASRDANNVYYSSGVHHGNYILDSQEVMSCEVSFQSIGCKICFNVFHSENCNNSNNIWNCFECNNCSFCYNCSNLENKSYYINNKPYTKEEYEKTTKNIQQISKLHKNLDMIQTESSFGNVLKNIKNGIFSYNCGEAKNIKYCVNGDHNMEFIQDGYGLGREQTLGYEIVDTGVKSYKNSFGIVNHSCHDTYYTQLCHNSGNLFGCIGLRNKEYCILNKQYKKEEYEQLVPKMIEKMIEDGERGEFFDPNLSPFAYNETIAQEYFPLSREDALARGYKRQDNNYDPVIPEGTNVVKKDQVENLKSDEEILKSIFICETSGRPFRIIKQELDFYRKHNIPLPTKHPDIRHQERMKLRPKRELHLRNCDKCGIEIVSVYSKDFEGKVYCEKCYQKEIY